ncbi:hypothetical protein D5278_18530 [bacterium 1XD21-13]|nr:hypothetical protein [bacterium 1XD21-13]
MKRMHKILLAIFCVGILLTGIGVGVVLTEFSALAYGGKEILGNTDMRTENFDVEFEPGEERTFITGWYQWKQDEVLTDAGIPENTVRFCVTYNKERIAPCPVWEKEYNQVVLLERWVSEEDDMELMMQAKDLFLKNLKAGRLISFDTLGVEEVTVTVNPANKDDVRLVF